MPVAKTRALQQSSGVLKQRVNKTLSKEATFLARENPALLEKYSLNFDSEDSNNSSSDEYELDVEGWKANLSQEDRLRLSSHCEYDPFKPKKRGILKRNSITQKRNSDIANF